MNVAAQTLVPAAKSRVTISKQSELPRYNYPVVGTATTFVESDDSTFGAFAANDQHDIDVLLADYQIDDKSTLSQLLSAKLNLQELAGDFQDGLMTIEEIRSLEPKLAARMLSGVFAEARSRAALETGVESRSNKPSNQHLKLSLSLPRATATATRVSVTMCQRRSNYPT
jgi:hypothetical protein